MGKKQTREGSSKRQQIREQRLKKQRQQRMTLILGVSAVALVFAGLFIVPAILQANAPVGEIQQITPKGYPDADGAALGKADAPVLIEVYEDFQCPSCRSYSENIEPQVVENLVATGKARYVFRQYPFLDDRVVSKESDQAANASLCAAEQERFWDYHDILFANWDGENKGSFSNNRLVAFAEALDLDMAAFNACFEANRHQDQIEADIEAARAAGVTGTPSVFVNGTQLTPGFVPSFGEISNAVEAELAKQGN